MATRSVERSVIGLGSSLAFLSFLDRAAISQAAPEIIKQLHLSPAEMGAVFSAFGITYALGEIPSGWLGDRFGSRRLLTRVVLLWSLFTAATGLAWSYGSMLVIRLLFGAGESGCFPGLARMFRAWLPRERRGWAEGIKAASARWGAAITPGLFALFSSFLTWRETFFVLGGVGVVWAVAFSLWHRGRTEPLIAEESHRASGEVWGQLLSSKSVWALGIQWFCHYYGFYFYVTWLPIYLFQARHLDLRHSAAAASLPLLAAGLGSLVAGSLSTRVERRTLAYIAYLGAAGLLVACIPMTNPVFAILTMSLSSFAAELSGPGSWTAAMDIGGENVGAVAGFMNMLGHSGAAIAPSVTGLLLSATGNAWNVTLVVSALVYAAGALAWYFIDSSPMVRVRVPVATGCIP